MTRNDFYQHITDWVEGLLRDFDSHPFFLGINGPQGAGKSTLSGQLVDRLQKKGFKALTISIDDFYLTHHELSQQAHQTGNKYLQQRGYPGTHDIALGEAVLESLAEQNETLIPRYNKSAHQGAGDRAPQEQWSKVIEPQDLVILEGWMLGFQPQQKDLEKDMEVINQFLSGYSAWNKFLHGFLYLRPEAPGMVVAWRVESEKNRRETGQEGLTDEQAEAYVMNFLPAYELYSASVSQMSGQLKAYKEVVIAPSRLPKNL